MNSKSGTELLKLIGGGAIILAAFVIMMPGVLDYVGRIGRTMMFVMIAVGIGLVFVLLRSKLTAPKRSQNESSTANKN